MPKTARYLHITDTTLACSGLYHLAPDVADAIREWLHQHGLDENEILANHPVVRRPEQRRIEWSERGRGHVPTIRFNEAPADADDEWPAPFPQLLLDQAKPSHCPSCGQTLPETKANRS